MTNTIPNSSTINFPKLRFTGFSDHWKKERLGDYLVQHHEKSEFNKQYPVLTSSQKGIFLQKDYFSGKDVASDDTTGYNVVPRNYFTYRHMSDTLIFKFNINTIVDKGIVSTLYPVFTTKNINRFFLLTKLNNGNEFKKFAEQQKQGGSRTYVYFSSLKEMRINLPSLNEQDKVASFLSLVDSWINNLRSQKSSLESYKKSIMQKIFTQKIRFKYKDGKGYSLWTIKTIDEITVNFDNQRLPITSGKRIIGKYPYYGANGIVDYVNDYIFDGDYVLIAEDGVVDTTKYPIHQASGKFWANNHAHILKGNGVTNSFLYYSLHMTKFMKYISGSAQTKLNGQVLKKITVNVPCIEEQQVIADFLTLLDKNLESKQIQIKEAELWKKGLMQQMFV